MYRESAMKRGKLDRNVETKSEATSRDFDTKPKSSRGWDFVERPRKAAKTHPSCAVSPLLSLSRSFSVSSTSSAHLFFFLCSDRAKLASEVRVTQSRSEIPRLAVLCSKKSQRSPLGRSNISSLLGRPDDIYASVESRCTVYFIRGVPPLPRLPCSSLASSCFSQLLSLF